MSKKVYCHDCIHLHTGDFGSRCGVEIGYVDTPTHRAAIFAQIHEQNKYNDCEYYVERPKRPWF